MSPPPDRAAPPPGDATDPTVPRRGRSWGRVALWTVAALIAALSVGLLALTRFPVTLPGWATERVERRLSRDLTDAEAQVGDVRLGYDVAAQALRLVVRDLVVLRETEAVLHLPELRVAVDGPELLGGRVRPKAVALDGLTLVAARDPSGRFSLALGGGGGALPSDWAEALAALDAVLALPGLAALEQVTARDVTVRLSDAVTGLSQDLDGGQVVARRLPGGGARLTAEAVLPVPGNAVALTAELSRHRRGRGAEARFTLADLPLGHVADLVPRVTALTLVRGRVAAAAQIAIAEDGTPGPLRGEATLSDGRVTDRPRWDFDRARAAFAWVPGGDRIAVEEVSVSADDFRTAATGQLLLEDGITGPVQVQVRLGQTEIDPEALFDRAIQFDEGVVEARLTQQPLTLRLGQAMVTGRSGTARASGRLTLGPSGPEGTVDLAIPRMAIDDLKALWPVGMAPRSRDWFVRNLIGGTARDAVGVVRLAPGAAPRLLASASFTDGQFRYMRHMPPARSADGALQFRDGRLAIRVDRATVPALAPGQADGPGVGRIDIAGTRLVLPDALTRPPLAELTLLARGTAGDVMRLLDNRPFRLPSRLDRDPDFVAGDVAGRVDVRLPLRDGNAPADIDWQVGATLRDVETTRIVPGRTLSAATLDLFANPRELRIEGAATLEDVPFTGRYVQPLPPPSTQPIRRDPAASQTVAAVAAVPLPGPGRVTGRVRIGPEGLARFGVALDALRLSGATTAGIEVTLPPGGVPSLAVASDLTGLAAAIPAVGWAKARDRAGDLSIEMRLGPAPEVTALSLDAPGLDASGRIAFRADGSLDAARFDRVALGWFDGPVTFAGRGQGASPAIEIGGGRADLRRALLSTEGAGGGDGAPLRIALDRLQVTEGIALDALRAEIRGGSGTFSGRVNGAVEVQGALAPRGGGTAVQIDAGDAGAVLRAAGLFKGARGGTMRLVLQPTGREGVYAGALRGTNLRVRDAPALASLLQALSVVGILEQLSGDGLPFQTVEADFRLRPDDIRVDRASAVGPSMSITADGVYDIGGKTLDLEGVISPVYLVNGLFGALFGTRDEGLFGFTYRMRGPAADPQVSVNPLSILTPGRFREIFRSSPPVR